MAQTPKNSYPLPAYNYRVTIGHLTLGFSEVSGLNLEYEAVTYRHGLSYLMGEKIIPGMRQPIRVTLKRGVTSTDGSVSNWLQKTYANDFLFDLLRGNVTGPPISGKKDVVIDLCDEKGLPVVRWVVLRALPVKLDAPAFSANSNEVAIESLELVAHEIKIIHNPQ